MDTETIAVICHEANRTLCNCLEDSSQKAWSDAPDWQRESAINGVRFVQANPQAPPEASHVNWMDEKLEAGWKYGPVKNETAKTHPCLVPFEDLPVEQQAKDKLFQAIVLALS